MRPHAAQSSWTQPMTSLVVHEEPGSSDILSRHGFDERPDDDTQKLREPSQEQAEVITGSGRTASMRSPRRPLR